MGPQPEKTHLSVLPEDRFRLLVDAVVDYAIYMLDPAGNVASWNSGAQRFKGYRAEEITGSHFSRFYSAEDRAAGAPAKALAIAARTGKFEGEGWRIRKDGTRFWAHFIIDSMRNTQGELLGFAMVTRDLTERRAAEEALRKSEEEFRLLVQSVTDYGIYMLDAEGHVTTWNAGAQHIKGYTPEEIIGRHFSDFYTDEDRASGEPRRALETAAREGRYEKEGWRVRKNGARFWAHVIIDPVRGPDSSVIGFAKVTRDITERRNAQAQLERARDVLFQSQKMDTIGQLTGGVAHDFNNLLTAVMGSLELVRKRHSTDEKSVMLIDNALQAARRGAALTQRMLAFARRQELKSEVADIPALVNDLTGLLDQTLGPAITLEVAFPGALSPVSVDVNQLEMALLNLSVNARDAMPQGGTIRIFASEEIVDSAESSLPKPGRYIRLSVEDQGHGMDAATMARATEPFFTTKGVGKGTGLGLSMVHGLAEQMGGCLLLESRVGKGTIASLWLPVAEGATEPAPEPDGVRSTEATTLRGLSILAVDDDALVLFNTAAMLEDLGHSVTVAYSGEEARVAVGRLPQLDLMITDQAMPNMTGTELIAEIKRERPDLPILMVSAYADLPSDADADLPRIRKPFTQAHLAAGIAKAMRE